MRISWDRVAQFCGFLALLFMIRVCSYSFLMNMGISGFPTIPGEIGSNIWTLGLVFWEDFFFGVPIYFAFKYLKNKKIAIALTVVLSILFGLGHLYQGWYVVGITALLPYFVCYKYGKKYGFGTTMVCHMLYDFSTVLSVKMLPYILLNLF